MKIVQSLWSKPGQKKSKGKTSAKNKCGWPDKKYNYLSWGLSCHQFRKYYDEVELVTDRDGYDLLINKLGLPYTDVKIVLDDLNHYHPDLWAIGKLYAYSIQESPFIHADGDVYIWEKFSNDFQNASLLCQRKEEGPAFAGFYSSVFFQMCQHLDYYPDVLDKSIIKNNGIVAVNAGIIGGNNVDFYKHYTKKVFEFIDKNASSLNKIDVGSSNIIFEQFVYHALSEEKGEPISYFRPEVNEYLNEFTDFSGVPFRTKYIHPPGSLKRCKYLVDSLEYRVQADYPEYYYKVINLMKTNQI
jgi:hypothetical protein